MSCILLVKRCLLGSRFVVWWVKLLERCAFHVRGLFPVPRPLVMYPGKQQVKIPVYGLLPTHVEDVDGAPGS